MPRSHDVDHLFGTYRLMRGLKTDHRARIIVAGRAFIQNIRRGHYEFGVDEAATLRVATAFDELALAICPNRGLTVSRASASPNSTTPPSHHWPGDYPGGSEYQPQRTAMSRSCRSSWEILPSTRVQICAERCVPKMHNTRLATHQRTTTHPTRDDHTRPHQPIARPAR